MKTEIQLNRQKWMAALRSGQYIKGGIPKMDAKGRVIESMEGNCACAVLIHEVGGTFAEAKKKVGISGKQCAYIQRELSDKLETFDEVANKIESDVFGLPPLSE